MLRSTKLLPLCKGARNWLVAGTVYGPKATTDGSNVDDNSNRHEDASKNLKTIQSDFSKHARPQQYSDKNYAVESPTKQFVVRDASTFHQNVLHQNVLRTRAVTELGSGDGLARVGQYPAYRTPETPVSVSSVRKATGFKAQSDAEKRETTPLVDGKQTRENARVPCKSSEDSSSSTSSQTSFPSLGELKYEKQAFHANELREDNWSAHHHVVESEGSGREALSRSSSLSSVASDSSDVPVKELKAVAQQGDKAVSHENKAGRQHVHGQRESTTNKKSTSTQNRHGQHHRGRSNNESHKLVARVCGILSRHGWGDGTVRALDGLNTNLSAYQVNEVLKQQKEAGLALNFFLWARRQAGFKHDVHTYTTMLGILGRAKSFDALNRLLSEMINDGCQPNVVTYNRLIHCYGRANDLESSLKLFNVMQRVGCEPDRVTYCTLIDLQAKAGFHDSAMELYKQMQQAGFRPDTFTYSIIIHCLGKAGKLSAAYKLFCEMTDRGFAPSLVTYNIIIDLHAKAGKFDMALKLYNDLQEVGYVPDKVTYGIIMEVLGNCGHIEDAERVFEEMVKAGFVADNPIFGLMVDMWGKTGNAEKAAEWFNRMLDSGLQPNVPACNSLLSAYLRACFYDAAAQVLRSMSKWGLLPTLQTYTSLLSSCAASRARWEYDVVFTLMSCTGHPAHAFLCSMLSHKLENVHIRRFFEAMQFEELESRRGFADSLMDFLHRSGKAEAAGDVWEVAAEKNLYPYAVREKAPNYWSINLHVMSMGTAIVVLLKTLSSFRDAAFTTGAAPYRIDIITGWGRRSRVPGASLVKQAVEDLLRSMNSPFYIDGSNVGCFVGQGPALLDWLKRPQLEQVLRFA